MKQGKWYRHYGEGRYKYLLLTQMVVATEIRPDTPIKFPPDSMLVKVEYNGVLHIEKNYAWNGATGFPDLETMMRATLAHDTLYQVMREQKLHNRWRREADRLLRDVCIADGMTKPLALVIYIAVRIFGWYRV